MPSYYNPYFPVNTNSSPYAMTAPAAGTAQPNYTGYSTTPTYWSAPQSQTPQSQTPRSNTMTFVVPVQSKEAAASYPVAAGNTVLFMDYIGKKFWLKTTDANGITQSLVEHSFVVETEQPPSTVSYVTKEEFDALKKQFEDFIK